MSYRRNSGAAIRVGATASRDPVLAEASLAAANILRDVAGLTPDRRASVVRQRLAKYQGAYTEFRRRERRMLAAAANPNQATFDALRLAIANSIGARILEEVHLAVAQVRDGSGLGGISPKGQKIGCGVVGGAGVIGGIVASIYGGQGGGAAVGGGTGVLAETLGCNDQARADAQRLAELQAQAAQAAADAAVRTAEIQAQATTRASTERTKQIKTAVIGGGLLILLLGAGYAIVKT